MASSSHHSRTERPQTEQSCCATAIGFQSLTFHALVQLMRVAKPLFDPVAYRGATNRRRYYEEVALPRNLVVLGDAVCTFNPAYGQGISTAALQAATLQNQLQAIATALQRCCCHPLS